MEAKQSDSSKTSSYSNISDDAYFIIEKGILIGAAIEIPSDIIIDAIRLF